MERTPLFDILRKMRRVGVADRTVEIATPNAVGETIKFGARPGHADGVTDRPRGRAGEALEDGGAHDTPSAANLPISLPQLSQPGRVSRAKSSTRRPAQKRSIRSIASSGLRECSQIGAKNDFVDISSKPLWSTDPEEQAILGVLARGVAHATVQAVGCNAEWRCRRLFRLHPHEGARRVANAPRANNIGRREQLAR